MYARFEEVARLADAEVAALLEAGDEAERVWAAWVLGLRAAAESEGELLEHLEGEPTRGVRQHVLVILAALDAIEPIAGLALRDPSPEVRESACRLAARLVGPDREAIAERLARRFDREPADAVRAALLSEVRPDAPASLAALVDRSIRADRVELRAAASRALLRREPSGFPRALRDPALLEPDSALASELLAAWISRESPDAVLEALERHEPPVIARGLERVAALEPLSWSQVERFAAVDHRAVIAALLDAVVELDAAGWRWLLELVADADADSRSLGALDDPIRVRAIARLRELSPNPAGSSLSYVDRDFLLAAERLIAGLEASSRTAGALARREGAGWWGLRLSPATGSWLELAKSIYPGVAEAELIVHDSGDDPWIVSYRRGGRAHLLVYTGAPVTEALDAGGPLAADLSRFYAAAGDAEVRIDRGR